MPGKIIWPMMLCLSGCGNALASDSALVANLREPMKTHAAALVGEDVALMRRTGLMVIEKFDAGAR